MAEFTENFQNIIRPSFPFLDSDQSMELLNQFIGINQHVMDNSNMNMQNLMSFSSDSILCPSQQEFPGNLEEDFHHGLVHHHNAVQVSVPNFEVGNKVHDAKKRKIMDFQETSSANSTLAVSESGSKTKLVNFLLLFFFSFYSPIFMCFIFIFF